MPLPSAYFRGEVVRRSNGCGGQIFSAGEHSSYSEIANFHQIGFCEKNILSF